MTHISSRPKCLLTTGGSRAGGPAHARGAFHSLHTIGSAMDAVQVGGLPHTCWHKAWQHTFAALYCV